LPSTWSPKASWQAKKLPSKYLSALELSKLVLPHALDQRSGEPAAKYY